jgi:hypothetical protein
MRQFGPSTVVTRRYHNFAPFVRQISEGKAHELPVGGSAFRRLPLPRPLLQMAIESAVAQTSTAALWVYSWKRVLSAFMDWPATR